MPLPPSGPISMSMINVELALPATQVISLNQANVRALAQVPAGAISLSNFYGKSNITPAGYVMGGRTGYTPNPRGTTYEWNLGTQTGAVLGATTPTGDWIFCIGNAPDKSMFGGAFTPSPTTATQNITRFPFSTKTFTSIGQTPAVPVPTASFWQVSSRMQTPTQFYSIRGTPSPTGAFPTVWNKWNYVTETGYSLNNTFVNIAPAPLNSSFMTLWRASINGFQNYARGWNFNSSVMGTFNYPTETGSVAVGGPTTLDMGSTSTSPATTNQVTQNNNVVAIVQSNEDGFMFIGAQPGPSGNLFATSMARYQFSTQTGTKSFQAVGVTRNAFTGFQQPTVGTLIGGQGNAFTPGVYGAISEVRTYTFGTGTLTTISQSSYPAGGARQMESQSVPMY